MTSGIVTGLFSPLCGVIFHGEGDPEKSPAHFTGKHPAGPSTEPFHTCTVPKRKNGFGTVQKFIFYGSNFRKCHSEPYFSWRDTVEKLKILFLTVTLDILYGYIMWILILNRIGASCQVLNRDFPIWEKKSTVIFPQSMKSNEKEILFTGDFGKWG